MATKIAPSRKFQRSMKPLTTVFTTTTSAEPTMGPEQGAGAAGNHHQQNFGGRLSAPASAG